MEKFNETNEELLTDELAKKHKLKIDMTYNEYVIVNVLNKIKLGQVFFFNSNAELIKSLFSFNYETWQKDTFELSEKITMCMVNINKSERKFTYYWDNEFLVDYSPSDLVKKIKPILVVFEIDYFDMDKQYIYRGLYTLEQSMTTTEKRYYKPIELEE